MIMINFGKLVGCMARPHFQGTGTWGKSNWTSGLYYADTYELIQTGRLLPVSWEVKLYQLLYITFMIFHPIPKKI